MKFSQLAIGQRFRHQGEAFVKNGPLQAIREGSSRAQLIMRAADVELLGDADSHATAGPQADTPWKILESYHRQCREIVRKNPPDALRQLDELFKKLTEQVER